MKPTLLACLLVLCSLPLCAQKAIPAKHVFTTQGDHFALDGKPFKVLSGELHYERIPRAYWQTLYVPGPWLHKGSNQIVVFDLAPQSERPHVAGMSQPILNGPVADQSTKKQE
ncbi:MAG: hypothetical protein BGO25_09615 [Acidobacteriales bacterium 59-55]|nr:beta-galactosidase [Terriglobales bacterium]OJV40035.1 MAG: hypothetical protein BGO25_09615 [Acidobacteriales bacterium 59-55]